MTIETDRLELVVLTADMLACWLNDVPAMERALDCLYAAEPMDGFMRNIVRAQWETTLRDPGNYMWHSFWLLIRRSDRIVVGSADFKSLPNERGEVEIGYGLGKQFEHNGYMTEAVKAMCAWAMRQPNVSRVIAETNPDGFASQRVLRRCGFREYTRETGVWFCLDARNEV